MTPLLAQRLRTDRSFERIYRRHVADVYHYALAVARNEADAEDVTQTTFLNAYRAFERGEHPRAPKNWLLAIAHNVLRQRFRQAARRPDEVELHDAVAAVVPDEDGYSAEDIRRALGEIAFNQKAALVMRELEGRSYSEIAEILGLSLGAVETLIFRARRALREQLEGSLACNEAELAISRQLDGRLPRAEKSALRAHLRVCHECSSFARSQRAQRAALRGLAAIPLPSSLASLFGGGAAVGGAVATKAAAVTAVGLLVAGGAIETAKHVGPEARPAAAEARSPGAQAAGVVSGEALDGSAASRTARRPVAAGVGTPVERGNTGRKAREEAKTASTSERAAQPTPPVRARGRLAAPGQVKGKPQATGASRAKARGKVTAKPRPTRSQRRAHARQDVGREGARGPGTATPPPKEKGRAASPKAKQQALTVTVTVPGTGITVSTPRLAKPKKR